MGLVQNTMDNVSFFMSTQQVPCLVKNPRPYFRSSDKDELAASNVEVLQDAFDRTKATIFSHRFVPRKFHPRKVAFEPEISDLKPKLQSVTIEMASPPKFSKGNTSFILEESYSLEISTNGSALILTGSVIRGLHALETFAQLFYAHSQSKVESHTSYAPISIVDGPAFKHRGLNLDISRNCIPPSDVMRVLEAMACNKMNRLHIHASDAQSWPLEVPTLPNLALEGAYEPSQIWTTKDLRHVQRYGQLRGIEVYLEIDIPGHTTAIAMSQPELVTAANREPWPVYAEEPPSGQLRLNSTEVFTFLTSLLGDVLPRNAQFSHIFHFGGDELNLNAYGLDPGVNSTSKDVLRPLLQSFMNHVFDMAMKHSLTPILWEEMLLDWDLSVPDSTIIQTWRSNEALSKVLSRGHQVLFGSNTHFYLDCGHGAFLDPTNPQEPNDDPRVRPPYLDHCGPYKNWRHVYSYNPLAGIPDGQLHLILGGEAHMWGEMTDTVTLDGML